MKDGEARQSSLDLFLAVLVALPLFYVLSVGPVVKVATLLDKDGDVVTTPLKTFYTPLLIAHDRTPLRKPLEWYVKLWGVR